MNYGMLIARSPLRERCAESLVRFEHSWPALRPPTAATLAHRWNEIAGARLRIDEPE